MESNTTSQETTSKADTASWSFNMEKRLIQDKILLSLCDIYDPEIGLDIVSLGLIYLVDYDEETKEVNIDLTLTSPYCPMGGTIMGEVKAVAESLEEVNTAKVNLTFDPPWNPREHASEEAQLELGIY